MQAKKKDYSKPDAVKRRDTISGGDAMPSIECNSREVHAIEFLAGLDSQLNHNDSVLEYRLKRVGAWQMYRAARALMEKALDKVYDTVPDKTLKHLINLSMHGEVVIRPKNPINTTELQLVSVPDLTLICNSILTDKCRYCLNDRAEQKGCKIRKAFMRDIPPDKADPDACAYRAIVQDAEFSRDEFISY